MKKLLLILLLGLFILPFSVFAKEKVPVYLFRGEGCPHCAEAEAFFKSLENTMSDKFEVKDYEVWNDRDNAMLMQAFATINDEAEEANGVPYIVIGDKSWIGYIDTYDKEIKEQIEKVYEQDTRYDVMKIYETEKDNEYSIYDFENGEENNNYEIQDEYEDDFFNDNSYSSSKEDNLKPLKKILPILIGVGVVGILFVVGITVLIIVLVTRKKK